MRAVFYERCGPADEVLQVGEVPEPEPGPGEVRVRLAASGVNPSDVKSRAGARGGPAFERIVPHSDGAGRIDAVGPDVPDERVGERVWVYEAQWRRPFGTAAEATVVPARRAVRLPEAASFEEGACLGIPAMTAHRCLFASGPVDGRTVLVSGGTGRVGYYAVQLAKQAGATVVATVGSDDKAALATKAGADHVLNYRSEDLAARVLEITGNRGADGVVEVEFGPNLATDIALLAANGWIATYASMGDPQPQAAVYPLMLQNATVHFVLVYDMPEAAKAAAVDDITGALEARQLQHQIGLTVPLERTAEAHRAVEDGAQGCVIVQTSA